MQQRGGGVDAADGRLDIGQRVGGDEIRLVEDDAVRHGNLPHALVERAVGLLFAQLRQGVQRVDHGDNAIQLQVAAQRVVHPEHAGDGDGVDKPRCFEQDVVKLAAPLHQVFNRLDAVVPVTVPVE